MLPGFFCGSRKQNGSKMTVNRTNRYEQRLAPRCSEGMNAQAGVNEAGRGCLSVMDRTTRMNGLNGLDGLNDLNDSSMNDYKMKTTITNLKKAVQACASAHRVEFVQNDSKWGVIKYWTVKSKSVPVLADLEMICEAFGGDISLSTSDTFNDTIIWWYDLIERQDNDVNERLLALALPYGTTI